MKGLHLFSIILTICFISACKNDEYCESLEESIRFENRVSYLIEWVEKNIENQTMLSKETILGGGMRPGRYWLNTSFNWDELGFSRNSQIRLISESSLSRLEYLNNIESVFFGERSGYGFLVKLSGSGGFGIDSEQIELISSKIAVICSERD